MIVSLIVACGKNRELGFGNKLLWSLPEELKNFKNFTCGHHIIMGRKTFESIGRPLPKRANVVITRNKNWNAEGVTVTRSVEEAIKIAEEGGETEAFICGGGQIYKEVIENDLADKLYLTSVDWEGEADTFFPCIDMSKWSSKHHQICGVSENNRCSWKLEVFEKFK